MSSSDQKYTITPTHSHSRKSQSQPSQTHAAPSKKINSKSTTEWIGEVLRRYLGKYVRDFLSNRKDIVPSPVTSRINVSDGNGNRGNSGGGGESGEEMSSGVAARSSRNSRHGDDYSSKSVIKSKSFNHDALSSSNMTSREKMVKMGLSISELEFGEETALGDDRITYLSKILSLGAKYSVAGRSDHFVHWLVKLPSNKKEERNLARRTKVYIREVDFYTNILQDIKHWLELNFPSSPSFNLNVPTCYYAHCEESSEVGFDPCVDTFPNPEYTLVLDDLRTQGFGKRHYSIGLSFHEAIEVMREIAKFHATCWAMAQHSGVPLTQNWPGLMKWEDVYALYLDMVREGFHHLHQFKRDFIKEKSLAELVDAILVLEPKLPFILQNLLRPLPPPSVTSLIHLDLWTDNLLFRDGESAGGVGGHNINIINTAEDKSSAASSQKVDHSKLLTTTTSSSAGERKSTGGGSGSGFSDLDCMILDWQMVSYGRISHDLGIFMMTSLDGNVRRDHGIAILQFYFETFEKIVNSFKLEMPFDLSDIVAQYKDSCLLATLLSISRLDLVVSEQSTLKRFLEALADLRDEELI